MNHYTEDPATIEITDQQNRGDQKPGSFVANMFEVANRWERFKEHHNAVGQAFIHSVMAGIEIVHLKLALPHGSFTNQAKANMPSIAARTLRRYREIGEWYLTAAHQRVVTVAKLGESGAEVPQPELCLEEFVRDYISANSITCAEDLKSHAFEKVPEMEKVGGASRRNQVENLMGKIRRAFARMSPLQRELLWQRFNELQNPGTKEPLLADKGLDGDATV